MKKFIMLVTIYCLTLPAYAANIDLNSWTSVGSGNWNVSTDGSSVLQTVNTSNGTYFLSDVDYINKEFEGRFKVETSADDDFIGFVFGYNSPSDYYLFDWKQNYQNAYGVAQEGFTLAHVTSATSQADFWQHNGMTILGTDYGSVGNERGWADNVDYDFSLIYRSDLIEITIDGGSFTNDIIFSVTGTYNTGKFGFYNFSQQTVRYQGFTEDVAPPVDPVPEPATMLLLGLGLVGIAGFRKKFQG